ncbi:hypothetical protein HN011_004537 [Eciton burchellii]|nr:hypothetical protein HN011_004537 [Eciton burchellii]
MAYITSPRIHQPISDSQPPVGSSNSFTESRRRTMRSSNPVSSSTISPSRPLSSSSLLLALPINHHYQFHTTRNAVREIVHEAVRRATTNATRPDISSPVLLICRLALVPVTTTLTRYRFSRHITIYL